MRISKICLLGASLALVTAASAQVVRAAGGSSPPISPTAALFAAGSKDSETYVPKPVTMSMAAAPAAAEAVIALPEFSSIELNGGGTVILRYGPQQRVTLIRGSLGISDIRVLEHSEGGQGSQTRFFNRDQLVVDTCDQGECGEYQLVVEVVTPSIGGISVNRGGTVEARGKFPQQDNIGIGIHYGGKIDLRSMPISNVGAAVSNGGSLLVRAESSLGASVRGGGEIRYWGNPAVGLSIKGGGTVLPGN